MRTSTLLFLLISTPAFAGEIETCFVPGRDCTAVVVREVDAAQSEILVQAYGFTSSAIADALLGVKMSPRDRI